jgi:hypothetical protein
MTALVENPMPWILFGILVEAALAIALFTTQRGALLFVMIGVLLFVLGGLVLERLVVTERERVEATIETVRAALERNDFDTVLQWVSEKANHTRSEAMRASREVEFIRIKVTDMAIDPINELTSPPTAKAHFTSVITVRGKSLSFDAVTRPIQFHLTFRREGDRWVVAEHKLDHAPGGY